MTTATPTASEGIRVTETGLVYRNPRPNAVSRHAYFPSVTKLPGGDFVAGMDIGQAFEANDIRSYVCRSRDNGKTWSPPQLIFDPGPGLHSTTCRIARTNSGDLIGWTCLFRPPIADVGHANEKTHGFVRTDLGVVRSSDGGATWAGPTMLDLPIDWRHFETCSPPIAVGGTRLMTPVSVWPDWEGRPGPETAAGIAFISDNDGRSFDRVVTTIDHGDPKVTAWEQKLIQLSDGRLMVLCWVFDHGVGKNRRNHFALSSDGGDSFQLARATPLNGETATPVALSDSRVLVVYRRADEKGGLWGHLARIEVDGTWTGLGDACLWGGGVQGMKRDADHVIHQMSTLRFGCPTVASLDDGSVFAAFWCVEDCVSNIRWLRIRP